jgi:hypothetical protein
MGGMLLEVPLVGGDPSHDRIGPADPPDLGGDLAVVQVRIVAAVTADDLEHVGIAALRLARDEAGGWRRSTTVQSSPGRPSIIMPPSAW